MKISTKFEYRGFTSTLNKDKTKSYNYVNVEDSDGESAKFLSDVDTTTLKKGTTYEFVLDYSTKYGSIKVVGVK